MGCNARTPIPSHPLPRLVHETGAGKPLSPQAVWRIVKRRAKLAGLEGNFRAHSLRSRFVSEAAPQNVSPWDSLALSGYHTVQAVLPPFKSESLTRSRAVNLVGESRRRRDEASAPSCTAPQYSGVLIAPSTADERASDSRGPCAGWLGLVKLMRIAHNTVPTTAVPAGGCHMIRSVTRSFRQISLPEIPLI
jgi:hypothetical protein